MTRHRTGTGHVPQIRAASWSCTCGRGEVRTYGLSVDVEWVLRLMAARAAQHLALQHSD